MNDIIASSLVNLLALFSSDNNLDKEQSLKHISDYLKYSFRIRETESYINLYTDLRDFYDDSPEIDKGMIVEGVCSKLKGSISRDEQCAMTIRLLQLCSTGKDSYDPQHPIFRSLVDSFEIPDELYSSFIDFVSSKPGESVHVIPLHDDGLLTTLFLKEYNILYFYTTDVKDAFLNDIPVNNGLFQVWQQSSVLKSRHFQPLYYSTVMSTYESVAGSQPIELCGRDVNFRFEEGGDNGMHNFSFTLRSGQFVAIMGGSGVGKSTLLSLLNGNLRPQSGSITINGHDICEPAAKALIGFVPQDDLLIEELTVYQNLWYTAKLCFDKMPDDELDTKVMSVLTQLGLDAARDLKVGSPINKFISGGQRKRLNIALELIREPAILFLDEPTSGLSSTDTEKVANLLKEQAGKGKLVVVNIHQPSSDVYKLFDRLWLLDKGGYPVYDGNPIEAVSYFKTAANFADADISACPGCGNVNPEVVLNIIDERGLDTTGHLTEHRKVSPQEWHSLYLSNRPEMEPAKVEDVPVTEQKKPGWLKQVAIFLRRNICAKATNLQYVLVTLLEAPLLAAICALLTRYTPDSGIYTLLENKNLPSYIFMAIIVAIFLGMSGSAEEIIKDRALLKREKFLRLSYTSYITSKVLFMAVVCLIQTLLFIVVGNSIIGVHGLFWQWWGVLFISAFLSGLIGLLLSQFMNSVVAIYITIPLLLIPQILLCGLVVKFDDLNSGSETGNVPVIGDVIPSRWSYEALAVANFTQNGYEKMFFEQDRDKYSAIWYENAFLYELESQLETFRDETERPDKEVKPIHMQVLHAELPHLAEVCKMEPYTGPDEYAPMREYLDVAKKYLKRLSAQTIIAMDGQVGKFIRENSKEELLDLKKSSYNLTLEDLLINRDTEKTYVLRGKHIVPKTGYVFLTPRSKNGRAPFYSGVKVVGDREIDTFEFDIFVLLFMCILVGVCLYCDFPGKFVRKERN